MLIKRVVLSLVMLSAVFPMFAEDNGSAVLHLSADIGSAAKYEIGLSYNRINTVSDAVSSKSALELSAGTIGNDTVDIIAADSGYVYWKIVSSSSLTVRLRIEQPLIAEVIAADDSTKKSIDWTADIYAVDDDDNEQKVGTIGSAAPGSIELLNKGSADSQVAGSRRVEAKASIKLDDYWNYQLARYSSNLILEVISQ